jgi:transposase-like protein
LPTWADTWFLASRFLNDDGDRSRHGEAVRRIIRPNWCKRHLRYSTGCPRFRCAVCRKSFSITSGTLFASRKLPLRGYLAAIAIFCNEVKGKSVLALSRDLGTSYKAAFVLAHKLREAMAEELKGRTVGGEGKTVEIDGGCFGGYVKPANRAEDRLDRRLTENQSGKRKVVVVVRQRGGNAVPGVFKSEAQGLAFIRSRIAKGTVVNADESNAWDSLHARYEMKRINHLRAPAVPGFNAAACRANGLTLCFRPVEIAEGHFGFRIRHPENLGQREGLGSARQ